MKVVDTAGIRGSADPLESEGVRKTKGLIERADMLIVVLDVSRPLDPEEKSLLKDTCGIVRVIVANKTDLTVNPGCDLPPGSVRVSAMQKKGIEELKKAVYQAYMGDAPGLDPDKGVATTVRQTEALKKIMEGGVKAQEAIGDNASPELVAIGIDEALMGLGELTGEVTTEEVLKEIFDRFCIGK